LQQENTDGYIGSLAKMPPILSPGPDLNYTLNDLEKKDIPKICLKFDPDFAIVYLDVYSFVELD